MTAGLPPATRDLDEALQRLNDSLQVLVLLLPLLELDPGSRIAAAEAAKRALEDTATFRECVFPRK